MTRRAQRSLNESFTEVVRQVSHQRGIYPAGTEALHASFFRTPFFSHA
jgi:hypothetical protein